MTSAGRVQPLIPGVLRIPAAIVTSWCGIVLLFLGTQYVGQEAPGRFDSAVSSLVEPVASQHQAAAWIMIQFGDPAAAVVLTAVLTLACYATGRIDVAMLTMSGMIITAAVVLTLKPLVGRTLGDTLSFPSGHTAAVTVVGTTVALFCIGRARGRTGLVAALASANVAAVAIVMGLALVATNQHYATDIVGGFCLAIVVVVFLAFVLDAVGSRQTTDVR